MAIPPALALVGVDAEALRTYARGLAAPASADRPDRHWATLATIIGVVEDRGYWRQYTHADGTPYASARDWAEEELGIPRSEYFTIKGYYLMMKRVGTAATWEQWAEIPRAKADWLRKVIAMGGDPRVWLMRARATASTRDFAALVSRAMGEEMWLTVSFRIPQSLEPSLETALHVAKAEAGVPDDADEYHPAVAFRLLEVILSHYLLCAQRSLRPAYLDGDRQT